nr:uncharacterized protein LOC111415939 [Onthophagus taurus]
MWIRANAGSRITDYDIAGLVNQAFTKVVPVDIAISGFKCTGIHKFYRHIFSDLDYLPADVTNIPLEQSGTSSNAAGCTGEVSVYFTLAGSSSTFCDAELCNNLVSEESKDTPKRSPRKPTISSSKPSTSFEPNIVQFVHNLSPLPDASKKRSAARRRKCEKSEILTSSPYKIAVEEKENGKNVKDKKKRLGNRREGETNQRNKSQRKKWRSKEGTVN